MRLLFIESDRGVQRWIAAQAEQLEVDVSFVDNRKSESVPETEPRPDAIVMDVASCGELRGAGWKRLWRCLDDRSVPLLVYSSCRRLNGLAECLGSRCNGFLKRPFTLEAAVVRAKQERDALRLDIRRPSAMAQSQLEHAAR